MGIVVRDSQGDFLCVCEQGVRASEVRSLERLAGNASLSEKGKALAANLAQEARLWKTVKDVDHGARDWRTVEMLALPVLIGKVHSEEGRITQLPVSLESLAKTHEVFSAWKKGAQTLNRELKKIGHALTQTDFASFFLKMKPEALAALSVEQAKTENFLGSMEGYCAYFPRDKGYFERQANGRWGHTELLARATPFESASAASTFMRRKGLSQFVIVQTRLQAAKVVSNPQNVDIGDLAEAMACAEAQALQEVMDAQTLQALRERAQGLAQRLDQMEAAALAEGRENPPSDPSLALPAPIARRNRL